MIPPDATGTSAMSVATMTRTAITIYPHGSMIPPDATGTSAMSVATMTFVVVVVVVADGRVGNVGIWQWCWMNCPPVIKFLSASSIRSPSVVNGYGTKVDTSVSRLPALSTPGFSIQQPKSVRDIPVAEGSKKLCQ